MLAVHAEGGEHRGGGNAGGDQYKRGEAPAVNVGCEPSGAYAGLLRVAVDSALEAPRSSRGTALAELSLSLGLVEEYLVSLVKTPPSKLAEGDAAAAAPDGDVDRSLQPEGEPAEKLLREIPSLVCRMRADASATVPPAQVTTLSPRATVAAIANALWRRSGANDNNNTLHLQTALSSLRGGDLDCFGLATTTLISVALLLVRTNGFTHVYRLIACSILA